VLSDPELDEDEEDAIDTEAGQVLDGEDKMAKKKKKKKKKMMKKMMMMMMSNNNNNKNRIEKF